MTLISARDSAHELIVKFSASICVAIVAFLIGEMTVRCFVCRDKTLNQQCIAHSGLPPDDISHLTSFIHERVPVTLMCLKLLISTAQILFMTSEEA